MSLRAFRSFGIVPELVACAVVAAAPAAAAGAQTFQPHRAFYTISLAQAHTGSRVADARGAMVLEWADSCDGWTVEQRYRLQLAYHEQPGRRIDSSYSTWEAKDGLSYRFSVRTLHDGRVVEELVGEATLTAAGEIGTADYTVPEGMSIALPAGTVFPTEHTVSLIDELMAGERSLLRVVFDGATLDQPLQVSAFAGTRLGPTDGGALQTGGAAALAGLAGWRIHMAVFPHATAAEMPDYEIDMALFDNGIAGDMILDYGDFAIHASLDDLQLLPPPAC